MPETLALLGGPRTIPEGTLHKWPPVDEIDRRLVLESLNSTFHVAGPQCRRFEEEFCAWNGNRFAFNAGSGTAALHMCVAGVGCSAGDEILCPAYSWPSSCMCILHHGCLPVFVDIDFATINVDAATIEAAITPRTKAILAVHLHGLACDMDVILEVARRHHLMVIEDCAQGHGATYHGRKVGTFGHAAAFSCNQNKLLCGGEGGLFVTDDETILQRGKQLSMYVDTQPRSDDPLEHPYALGYKYLGCDLSAAFARAQLSKLDGYLERIAENAAVLSAELAGTPGLMLPTEPDGYHHNWYNYTVRFTPEVLARAANPAAMRDKLVRALNAEGVGTGVWQRNSLPAMHVFATRNAYGRGYPWSAFGSTIDYDTAQFPIAERHSTSHTGMTDPIRPRNTPAEARLVARAYRKVMEQVEAVASWEP